MKNVCSTRSIYFCTKNYRMPDFITDPDSPCMSEITSTAYVSESWARSKGHPKSCETLSNFYGMLHRSTITVQFSAI